MARSVSWDSSRSLQNLIDEVLSMADPDSMRGRSLSRARTKEGDEEEARKSRLLKQTQAGSLALKQEETRGHVAAQEAQGKWQIPVHERLARAHEYAAGATAEAEQGRTETTERLGRTWQDIEKKKIGAGTEAEMIRAGARDDPFTTWVKANPGVTTQQIQDARQALQPGPAPPADASKQHGAVKPTANATSALPQTETANASVLPTTGELARKGLFSRMTTNVGDFLNRPKVAPEQAMGIDIPQDTDKAYWAEKRKKRRDEKSQYGGIMADLP